MPKARWENDAKDRFLDFLQTTRREQWQVTGEDVVVNPTTNKNFDYQLGHKGQSIALEIFRLIENEHEVARSNVWSDIVRYLKEELLKRGITDLLISTPSHFQVTRPRRAAFAKGTADQIEAAVKNNIGVEKFFCGDYQVTRISGLGTVTFSTHGAGGAVDPSGTAHTALLNKLPAKDPQLDIAKHERLLFVVNGEYFVDAADAIDACSRIDFDQFPHIDAIYFESQPGRINLIFDRKAFEAFKQMEQPPEHVEPLFLEALGSMLWKEDRKAFQVAKKLIEDRKTVAWLPRSSQAAIASHGTTLLKDGQIDDALWIFRTFKGDIDLKETREYDRAIAGGDDMTAIATVPGHICWLIMNLAAQNQPALYPELIGAVEQYSNSESVYVRQQSAFPLMELVRRRYAQDKRGNRLIEQAGAEQIRNIAFSFLRSNSENPVLMSAAAYVFAWLRDVTEAEAEEILSDLFKTKSHDGLQAASGLLIYFAIHRAKQINQLGQWNPASFQARLMEMLAGAPADLRTTLIWALGDQLKNSDLTIPETIPYFGALVKGPYERFAFQHLFRIIPNKIKDHADLRFVVLTALEREYARLNPGERIWHFEEVLESINQIATLDRECCAKCCETLLAYDQQIAGSDGTRIRELLNALRCAPS